MGRLQAGQGALVAGAGRGVGAALADLLASRGLRTACADADLAGARATAARVGGLGLALDPGDAAMWANAAAQARAAFGRLDLVALAAPAAGPAAQRLAALSAHGARLILVLAPGEEAANDVAAASVLTIGPDAALQEAAHALVWALERGQARISVPAPRLKARLAALFRPAGRARIG